VTKRGTSVEEAIAAIGRGEVVVVIDDEARENEGDLIMAAQLADTERLAFFVRHTSGLICTAITEQRADDLELPLMVPRNTEAHQTAFTVTVDARLGTSTGISAKDRAATIRTLVDPATQPDDLVRPGHLHVLRSRAGGVLGRPGHTEAAVDLARLAGLEPAGVLCEVVTADGLEMAREAELRRFAAEHDLVMVTIKDLVAYRRRSEQVLRATARARLPTEWGEFTCHHYESVYSDETYLAFVMGELVGAEDVLAGVHIECMAGDVFHSTRCDCGGRLRQAMARIAVDGAGVVVYLRGSEGRADLRHEVRPDERLCARYDTTHWGVGAGVLAHLGVGSVRLMTDDPTECGAIESCGIVVTEQISLNAAATVDRSNPAITAGSPNDPARATITMGANAYTAV
jgi:3,4-dihydroxy 2-butanone 4-phosphate synthase / GTP cyclohydrolase II